VPETTASPDFQRLFRSLPGAYAVLDSSLVLLEANAEFLALTGSNREDLLGRPAFEAFPDRDPAGSRRDVSHASFERVLARGCSDRVGLRYDLQRPDGGWEERHWVLENYPIRDDAGEVSHILHRVEDVTAEVLSLRMRSDAEGQLRAVFEQSTVGIARTDLQGRFLLANDRYCGIVGRGRDELLGLTMQEITHPDDLPRNLERFTAMVAGGSDFVIEKRYLRPDGSEVWVSNTVSLVRDSDGEPESVLAVTHEIGDRKEAEAALGHSEARHRLAVEAFEAGTWELDLEADRAIRSLRHDQIFGYETLLDEWGFEIFLGHVHPDDRARVRESFERAVSQTEPWHFECRIRRVDGEERWIEARGTPSQNPAGRTTRMHGLVLDITDRKLGEAHRHRLIRTLQLERTRLRTLAEEAPVAILVTIGSEHRIEIANAYFQRLVGERELGGRTVWEAFPEEDLREMLEARARVLETGEPYRGREVRVRIGGADGDWEGYLDISHQPLVGVDGRPGGIITVLVDVTGQVEARGRMERQADELERRNRELEEARRQEGISHALLDALYSGAPVALGFVDRDLRYVRVNSALAATHGLDPEAFHRKRVSEMVPELMDQLQPVYERALRGEAVRGVEVTGEIPGRPGRRHWLSNYYPVRLADGEIIGVGLAAMETTELVHASRGDRERARRLRELAEAALAINAAPDFRAMMTEITERVRRIVGAHQAVTSLTVGEAWDQAITAVSLSDRYAGYRDYDVAPRGDGIYRVVCEENRTLRFTQDELEAHPAWRGFGTERAEHPPMRGWLAVPLVSSADENLGLIQLSDRYEGDFTEEDEAIVTQLARLASAVIENARLNADLREANRAKADFLATMSHELRTPLNAIVGFCYLLEAGVDGELAERQREHVRRIHSSTQHLTDMIEEILTFSRMEAGQLKVHPEPVDAADLAREACALVEPLVTEKGVEMRCQPHPSLPEMSTDPGRLRQILLNLLSNAVKFTDSGFVELEVIPEGDGVRFTVRDTGAGIPPEQIDRIFEPFRQVDQSPTRRQGGTGLGLAVTRQLVDLLGGSIEVESEPGEGSTFSAWIPEWTPAEVEA
jgi:PAS domain S-box-containing protein